MRVGDFAAAVMRLALLALLRRGCGAPHRRGIHRRRLDVRPLHLVRHFARRRQRDFVVCRPELCHISPAHAADPPSSTRSARSGSSAHTSRGTLSFFVRSTSISPSASSRSISVSACAHPSRSSRTGTPLPLLRARRNASSAGAERMLCSGRNMYVSARGSYMTRSFVRKICMSVGVSGVDRYDEISCAVLGVSIL